MVCSTSWPPRCAGLSYEASKLQLTWRSLFAHPANFLALGAGSGLSPLAPGTVGTIAAIPVLLLMTEQLWLYIGILLVMFGVGLWCCGACATYLGVHDHPGIVWDEWVGYLITMIAVPRSFYWVLAGFVLFRFFDVLKPWPISWIDRRVHGGLGIMLDDVIAGLFAALILQAAVHYVP